MSKIRMKRSITHWTAGGGRANETDKKHYHILTEHDGNVVKGEKEFEDNLVTSDGDYAAHTRNLNTGSGGFGMCGMRGATESPLDYGPSPITEKQFMAHCRQLAEFHIAHGIPVTPETCLTHAEVQTNLGVAQRGKWDITVLPFRQEIRGARAVGDYMRSRVRLIMGGKEEIPATRPVVRFGDKGIAVAMLQADLASLGYFSGRQDGLFGPLLRAALLAFQADQDLQTDAVAGSQTWDALGKAEPRPMREVSQAEIDEKSGTAKDAKMTATVGDLLGVTGAINLVVQAQQAADQAAQVADAASGTLSVVTRLVTEQWQGLLLVGVCLAAWLALRALGFTQRRRRLRDAREHRSLAR